MSTQTPLDIDDGVSPLDISKSTLIQHTMTPTENTLRETPREQVADSVQADLFAWRAYENVESALTRANIRALNDVRFKGELFSPAIPQNYIDMLGSINAIPEIEGRAAVDKAVNGMIKQAVGASKLHITPSYTSTSELVKTVNPNNNPGPWKQSPFIPINTLGGNFKRDVSLNNMPLSWYQKNELVNQNNEMRTPLDYREPKSIPIEPPVRAIRNVDQGGFSWQFS
jgi:hypothetical protein